MKRYKQMNLGAVLITLFLASQSIPYANSQGCTGWCKQNGFDTASGDACESLGGCINGKLFPSESKSICPDTLQGCCCMSEIKQATMKIASIEIGESYKAGDTVNINIEISGFETVPNPQLSASFTDPALAEKYNTDLPITKANIRINYTIPANAQKGIWTFKAIAFSGEQRDIAVKNFIVDEKIGKYALQLVQPETSALVKGNQANIRVTSLNPVTQMPVELRSIRCILSPNGMEVDLQKETDGTYSESFSVPEDAAAGEQTLVCKGIFLSDGTQAEISKKITLIEKLTIILEVKQAESNENTLEIEAKISRGEKTVSSAELKLSVNDDEKEADFKYENEAFYTLYPAEGVEYITVQATDEYGQTASSQRIDVQQKGGERQPSTLNSIFPLILAAIGLLIIVSFGAYFFIKRKKSTKQAVQRPDDTLEAWVIDQYRNGYSAEYIQKYLEENGYDPSVVERVLSKAE